MTDSPQHERCRIDICGIVQGVGFRPFVFGLADELQLTGWVRNHSAGVTIELEGPHNALSAFVTRLTAELPPLARIDRLDVSEIPCEDSQEFCIVQSESEQRASTPISPDVAVCDACLAEMRDPQDRRFAYPFINCTNCGPRFTIIKDIPYDRPQTTMASFAMCELCETEYRDPANRRFHAQPNACRDCGPRVWLVGDEQVDGAEAFQAFHNAIRQSLIVAVKGIGGFHLACDATSDEAIAELRRRKGRVDKPLAIMVEDANAAAKFVELSELEKRLLVSKERPIVLLRRKRSDRSLSSLLAPGNDFIGVMLPYSPLHHLLFNGHAALVMTSGNLSEEPIARTNEEATARLAKLADAFLLHDREIHAVCDDSVVRVFGGHELPVRRSRGYAPLPIRLSSAGPSVLAVGGELKATFCVTKDDYAYLSQHIGDMANLETLETMERGVGHFCDLFRVTPERIACDLHPAYLSTAWAKDNASKTGIPLVQVQHHHAHIAGLRAEHGCREPVIGVCFDGTGYGTDGAIWGGEVLQVDEKGFERFAHLRYTSLPGGDASIKRPYRAALAQLWDAGLPWHDELPCVAACPAQELAVLRTQLERDLNCVSTSSMGRLFDAVASLIGVRQTVSYEAQAAMEMEAISTCIDEAEGYQFELHDASPRQICPRALLARIADDVLGGVNPAVIAGRFHVAIAALVERVCQCAREAYGIHVVALSGGVFQNVLLLEHVVRRLENAGFRTLTHRQTPPHDGGIALGQAVVARG